jgi:lipopolysaccharide biosynthesis regulator YciM
MSPAGATIYLRRALSMHDEHETGGGEPPDSGRGLSSSISAPRERIGRRYGGASRQAKGPDDDNGDGRSTASTRVLRLLLALTVSGSVLAIGSVHLPVLLVVAAAAVASAALAFYVQAEARRRLPFSLPVVTLLALSGYSLLQAMPLPIGALEVVAPLNADIWSRALLSLGEPGPRWASISLDPGASVIEGLKWLVYAAVFAAASVVGARRGAAWGTTVVFASATLAALTTIGHGLLGVRKVYGLYEPTFSVSPWHVGPLLNPNNLAGYLNLGAICGMGLMLMRRPVVPPWLSGLGVATIIAIELTSGSRAGVVALLLGVVAMAILSREKRERSGAGQLASKRLVLLLGAAVGGGAILAALGGTGDTWAELYDQNIQKVEMLRWATPMVRDYAWLGVGRGSFESVFPSYKVTPGNVVYTHAENFPMQWASEWGVPVALAAMIAFAIALSPRNIGVRRSAVAASAWVGLAVLLLQNLFDLGLEIPALCIAACTSVGSVWGDARRRLLPRAAVAEGDARPSGVLDRLAIRRSTIAAGGVTIASALVMILAARFGWRDLNDDRSALRGAYASADLRRPEARPPLRSELRAAMLRRPAEPYFPLLGALLAWRAQDQDPLPWLQRTLERDPINGRAHLLLADVLNERGAKAQALMELRLAAENDSTLVAPAAQTALRFTNRFEDLLRAVPPGKAGAATLDELAVRLAAQGSTEARSLCDKEAIARDPARVGPRMREARALIHALEPASPASSLCPDRAACERAIEEHAKALAAADPRSSLASQVRARRLMAEGRAEDAERLLAGECAKASDRAPCARLRVEAASSLKSIDRMTAAVRDYLSTECSRAQACADAATWAGNLRSMRGEWGAAMTLYARAARDDPGEHRWLALADAASQAGAHAQAVEALEKVAQKRGGADPALRRRIDDERARAAGALIDQ